MRTLLKLIASATAAFTAVAAAGVGDAGATPKVNLLRSTESARPGDTATFSFAVDGVKRCTLIAPGDRQTAITSQADRVTFSFTVSPSAKPGRRWVIAACAGVAPQKFPLTILSPRADSGGIQAAVVPDAAPVQVQPLAAPATPEQAAARAWWTDGGSKMLAVFRTGQCTDWASSKRPDIIERIEEAAYVADRLGKPFPDVDFVAKNWATLAKAAGMTISDTPVAGAIVVWQPGVEGASPDSGHVGYVESVGKGTFTTSEENVGAPYVMGHRTLSSAPVGGRVFIEP